MGSRRSEISSDMIDVPFQLNDLPGMTSMQKAFFDKVENVKVAGVKLPKAFASLEENK